MQLSALMPRTVLILACLAPAMAPAAPSGEPQRWVKAEQLPMRADAGPVHKVTGTLPRGAEVRLSYTTPDGLTCQIVGEGQSGYVDCRFLSTERIARRRAGQDGVDAMQRWVGGTAVTLRVAPQPDAAIAGRLAMNSIVKLMPEAAAGGYCKVQTADGSTAYTACRYLVSTPVVLAHLKGERRDDETPAQDFDPVRAFWLAPSWTALERYADYLKLRHAGMAPQGPWPRDEELERMKAHLALGVKSRKPAPLADWSALKRSAAQDLDLSGESRRLQAQGKKVPEAVRLRDERTDMLASDMVMAIGVQGPLHGPSETARGTAHVFGLMRALEFPSVKPSLFRSEAELAPPAATTEEASGRFGIIVRHQFTPRPQPQAGIDNGATPGLYDMLARTRTLVRSVQRVQLFRDGRLRVDPSLVRMRETFWRDVDESECNGWVPGFMFGDADAGNWRFFGAGPARGESRKASLQRNPAGSLFAFYANIDMPKGPAVRSETSVKMDRESTGFVGGTYLYYDLDGDAVADIALWEGQGIGPGDVEGVTKTDDYWYRLALVNVNGAWKVLGSDVFGYGCGC